MLTQPSQSRPDGYTESACPGRADGISGEPTLADVQREFPGWECYVSFGWCWARLRDDPDVRIRGEDAVDLRDMINRWTGLHGNGDTGT